MKSYYRNIKSKKISKPTPLIEKEDSSKMKSYYKSMKSKKIDLKIKSDIKNLKPKKLNIFKRMKNSVTHFFDKFKSKKNNSYEYHEQMNEETDSFDYDNFDVKAKMYLPRPYMLL